MIPRMNPVYVSIIHLMCAHCLRFLGLESGHLLVLDPRVDNITSAAKVMRCASVTCIRNAVVVTSIKWRGVREADSSCSWKTKRTCGVGGGQDVVV